MKKTILLICLSVSSAAFADSFYIERTVNGDQSNLLDTLYSLVKSEVANQGHLVEAERMNSQWTLTPGVHKLGDSYIMTLSKSRNGQIVFSDKLKSKTEGDLDVVCERLVKAALTNQKVLTTETVNSAPKREATRQVYFGFGPGYLAGLNADQSGFNWSLGYLWGLDEQFALRLNLEGLNASDSGADSTMLGLGGQYYVNNLKHSPYLLGLIGYSWSDSEDASVCTVCTGESDHGWAFEAGLGIHFYRNSNINLALELTHMRSFYNLVGTNPSATALKLVVFW
ncbi:MAG: outer membrane beta-barrel protein [Bdellovibrionales bacterium]